jgi:hypothetical protein
MQRRDKPLMPDAPAHPSVSDMLFPDGEAATRTAAERLLTADTPLPPGPGRPLYPPGPVLDPKPDPGHPGDDDLDRYCRQLLDELRKRCPDLLPTGPLPDGEVADTIDVHEKDIGRLFSAALGVDDRRRKKPVIWEQAGSELLVHLHGVRVAVLDGLVLVGVPIETVETKRVEVTISFAVGTPDRLAGMVVTTEAKPRGPAAIVDLWGEALIAFAWQTLLDVVERLAARTGVDVDGEPLLPGAIVANRGHLGLVPQAAHKFERRRR